MKKILISALLLSLISCRKDTHPFGSATMEPSKEIIQKSEVGRTLAKAMQNESQLRKFIKEESLKQFDNEYDILFAVVKEKKINNDQTFYDLLVQYADSKQKLDEAINSLPLLTIFVPTLPEFSPQNWDAVNQVPQVAIEPDQNQNNKTIIYYDAIGNKTELSADLVPANPTLVIKNNERVVVKGSKLDLSNQYANAEEEFSEYATVNGISYLFTGKAFDGVSTKGRIPNSFSRTGTNNPSTNTYTIDKVNVDAYNSGAQWHRDYVYYGIDPNSGIFNGVYRNNYHEFIKSFKFINNSDYATVSDDTNDPQMKQGYKNAETPWIEGSYEFYIDIVINSKNGTGSILHKSFSCRGSDLWNTVYQKYVVMFTTYYVLVSYSPKEYNPNLDLIPWDLNNYGNAWKFIVSEYDPSTTTTKTVTHNSTFGANFEITLQGIEKFGEKFGISATSTTTTSTTYTYTVGSDDLAEGIIAFDYAIITSLSGSSTSQQYSTYETSTGRTTFSVEPARVF